MLISSPRHTPADLRLWQEIEKADRLTGSMGARVARSLGAIQDFLSAPGPAVYAGVSHGKDSTVLWHLLWRARQAGAPTVDLWHLRPTNHNPDCDRVRDELLRRWPMPYHEQPVDYGDLHARRLPDHELDRLTDRRWYAAIAAIDARYGRHILGIRAGESGGRKVRMRRWGENSPNASAPIGWWTTQDVYAYLALNDLPVHPVYAMLGGGRWPRERLRVAELGDTHGNGGGRREWEREYYGDVLNKIAAGVATTTASENSPTPSRPVVLAKDGKVLLSLCGVVTVTPLEVHGYRGPQGSDT